MAAPEVQSSPPSPPQPAPPPPALNTTQAALPTLGATIGSAVGQLIAAKVGGNDPLIGNTIALVTTGVFTALFHWVATKLGGLL